MIAAETPVAAPRRMEGGDDDDGFVVAQDLKVINFNFAASADKSQRFLFARTPLSAAVLSHSYQVQIVREHQRRYLALGLGLVLVRRDETRRDETTLDYLAAAFDPPTYFCRQQVMDDPCVRNQVGQSAIRPDYQWAALGF